MRRVPHPFPAFGEGWEQGVPSLKGLGADPHSTQR